MAQSSDGSLLSRLLDEFHPRRLLPGLMAGLVIGIITVILAISFAALIFSGDLAGHASTGIGLVLFTAVVMGVVAAVASSFPGMSSIPQDTPTAILALIAAAIAARMAPGAAGESVFLTVVAAIVLTSLLTGVFFLALGFFKLGSLIRFVPYPVIGGFLAGTGWLLSLGSISVMTGVSPTLAQLPLLFQPAVLARWLPGLIFAVLLLVILRRVSHFLVLPAMLLGSIGLFYIALWLTNTPVAEAGAQGWLMGPFPESSLWQPALTFHALAQADWSAIFGQTGGVATILAIGAAALLLNASGIELVVEQDIDLNRELLVAGLGNIIAGLGGGTAGYQAMSLTALGYRIGARSRLMGLFAAAVCGAALIFGASLLSFFPRVVLGGLLMFLGLAFLVEWLVDAWSTLPKTDYAVVLLIVVVIGAVGFLEGVGVGLVATIILFVVNYSRVSVVKDCLSGVTYHSNVERPRLYRQILQRKGHWLYVLRLQGFIFFGTAHGLLEQIRQRIDAPDLSPPRFVVLDFRLVTGLDSSAVFSFVKLRQLAQRHGVALVFTHLSPGIRRRAEKLVFEDGEGHIFPDLDHGVEWCEDQMIATVESTGLATRPKTLTDQLTEALPGPDDVARLMEYLRTESIEPGDYLVRQGDAHGGIHFIESGQVTALLEQDDGSTLRLRTMSAGTVIGEMGVYLSAPASVSVVAEQPTTLYILSADALARMEADDPALASAFHRFMAGLLAERLDGATDTIQALLRD
jgi:SulP family sulfate permease